MRGVVLVFAILLTTTAITPEAQARHRIRKHIRHHVHRHHRVYHHPRRVYRHGVVRTYAYPIHTRVYRPYGGVHIAGPHFSIGIGF